MIITRKPASQKGVVKRRRVAKNGSKTGNKMTARILRSGKTAATDRQSGIIIRIDAGSQGKLRGIRTSHFGAVTVSNEVPDKETLVLNVSAGTAALRRAKAALVKPGVELRHLANVPKFRVDASNPKILIREMNGQTDRGRIVDGKFVSAE